MKGYLLDTRVALIGVHTPERLSRNVRKAIERGPAFLSTISYWEVIIKSTKGLLNVGDPRRWWVKTLEDLALRPLPQSADDIAAICDLPSHHRDPFDRALIAQATANELVMLTTDR